MNIPVDMAINPRQNCFPTIGESMINTTTRRHPRTMNEAFPQDSADWFEGPPASEGIAFRFALWCIYALLAAVFLKFLTQGI